MGLHATKRFYPPAPRDSSGPVWQEYIPLGFSGPIKARDIGREPPQSAKNSPDDRRAMPFFCGIDSHSVCCSAPKLLIGTIVANINACRVSLSEISRALAGWHKNKVVFQTLFKEINSEGYEFDEAHYQSDHLLSKIEEAFVQRRIDMLGGSG